LKHITIFFQVDVIFCPAGKTFLEQLQYRSGTYIWWSWSSTFLRIFGEDRACNKVYREIDEYIQHVLDRLGYSVDIPIPEGQF
jgi:hypothetical protein